MAIEILPQGLPQIAGSAATPECSPRAPERRQHGRNRIAGRRAATVNIDERNAALVVNLGEGGMRVQALGRPLQPGATLRLEFQLPGWEEPIHTSGVVAWVNDRAEAGIRFAEPSESLVRQQREWITKSKVVKAAREFMRVAGGWQDALDLLAELTRMLIGASGVAITLVELGKRPIGSWIDEGLPIRETVAAPIYESERIIGHLEISSTELGAFDEQDLGALSVLAAVVSEMVRMRAEMVELGAAEQREAARKASRLSARIVSRIEGMFPTVRVRLVF